ncbi:phosphodiesterase [Modestobacter muralis]|uniref:Phosphodiesterase n=1 Tax=Modestobacter muralis TaxID=1608614 RepID=A0A6P0H187_9ACTN|nr:phosphodiesterase [Modestobacter muralis]NEK92653.1 phosphodiesterase [Modestobacter muralis]NEN49420.1 phosphodiesterase [Modestobacter muralis]
MADLLDAAGRVAAVPLALLARARGGRPMHARGVVLTARLVRTGLPRPSGADWLDGAGTDDVLVRLSRGAGLPPRLPDLLGFALRAPGETPVDLLLSSAGRHRWTRRVPVLRRDPAITYGSIMGFRSPAGPVLLSVTPVSAGVFALAAIVGRAPEQRFARVVLGPEAEPSEALLHLDAVLHAPPGLVADGPMARFRRPAYAAARAALGEPLDAVRPGHP